MKNLIRSKFITALLVGFLLTATASAGVTNIKEIVNNTSEAITISKGTVSESWNQTGQVNQTRFSSKETTGEIPAFAYRSFGNRNCFGSVVDDFLDVCHA